MAVKPDDPWVLLVSALLGGGGLKFVYDSIKDWRMTPNRHVATIDASIVTVAKARDELEEDNRRLRETLAEERKQAAAERERSWTEAESLRTRIAALEQQVQTERQAAEQRYDAILKTVRDLKRQAARGPDTPGRGTDVRQRG